MPAMPGFPLLQPSKYPKKWVLSPKPAWVDLKAGVLNSLPYKKI